MPFFSGNMDMDGLIDLYADQLIATGAWVTADAGLPAGAHPAARALQHATDPNFFVYMARRYTLNIANSWQANEILIQLSTGFNTGTHLPSGTIQTTGIMAEGATSSQPGNYNKAGTHWTWIDASGITSLVSWSPTSLVEFSTFFTLERNTSKEYADGFSNFFCASIPNDNPFLGSNSAGGQYYGNGNSSSNFDWQRALILRPFNFVEWNDYNNSLAPFFGAYRSLANSKVYFEFPFFSNNQAPLQRMPIAQTARFFLVQPGQGLSDGDLVTYVSGPNTYTYLVKLLQSPDSVNYAPWAIRQA